MSQEINDLTFLLLVDRIASIETTVRNFDDKLERMISNQGFVCKNHDDRLDQLGERTRATEVEIKNVAESLKRRSNIITTIGCTIASVLGGLIGKFLK